MKANLKEILESIPDYEDFMKLAGEIGQLSFEKMRLENQIKTKEAETFRAAMTPRNPGDKVPSVSFVENAYLHTGFDGQLTALRDGYAYLCGELDKKRIQLSIYKDMIGLFQTVSANERASGF